MKRLLPLLIAAVLATFGVSAYAQNGPAPAPVAPAAPHHMKHHHHHHRHHHHRHHHRHHHHHMTPPAGGAMAAPAPMPK